MQVLLIVSNELGVQNPGFWVLKVPWINGFKAGTYRTFPVLRNVPRKVRLFLVSSVFPYSKGEQGR